MKDSPPLWSFGSPGFQFLNRKGSSVTQRQLPAGSSNGFA
jgi:hypothetical protein